MVDGNLDEGEPAMSRMSCVALILRAQPYGESDLIVDLYTQQRGRSRVIARARVEE